MASRGLVIANTTPLINFAEIDHLELLRDLFGDITVPSAVVDEIRAKSGLFPRAAAACQATFVRVRQPGNRALVESLTLNLHEGEAECIALALEVPSSLLVLDELAAREEAEHHGLRFTGTVGCLRMAKELGLIPAIAPLLDDLRTKARFWLAPRVAEEVLRDVGETSE